MNKKMTVAIIIVIMGGSILTISLSPIFNENKNRQENFKRMDQIDSGWIYNKTLTVYDNREKYQSKITIYNNSGRFNCSGNVKNDFSDLRFTAPNGTIIPHWFEEIVENESVVCWVNNYFNNSEIKYYYGNSSASSSSNATETWDYFLDWSTNHSAEFYEHWDASNPYRYSIMSKQLPVGFYATNGFRVIHKTAETYRYINEFGVDTYLGLLENTNETYNTESDNNTYSGINIDSDVSTNHNDILRFHRNGTAYFDQLSTTTPTIDDYNVYDIKITKEKSMMTIHDNTSNGTIIKNLYVNNSAPTAELDVLGYGSNHGSGDDSPDIFWEYDATSESIQWGATNDARSILKTKNKWVAIGKYQTFGQSFYHSNIQKSNITTNESTGIGETNATIHGYLSDDGGSDTILWMEWDENTDFSNIENVWSSNSSLVSGLGDVGQTSAPEFFIIGEKNCLIAGEYAGNFNGYNWNGTEWVTNTTLIAGLTDASNHAVIETFILNGSLRAISTGSDEIFYGYDWNGSGWDSNSSLVNGLSGISYESPTPTIFNETGTLQMISGSLTDGFYGYDWNGSAWISNSSRTNGLTDVGNNLAPEVFSVNQQLRLVSGKWNGGMYGWKWNGSAWVTDDMIKEGLTMGTDSIDGMMPKYAIFYDDYWKAIGGRTPGTFLGFDLNIDHSGAEISVELTGLTSGQLYWYRAAAQNDNGTAYGENKTFLTRPYTPSGLHIQLLHNGSLNLTWTKGNGANNTIIERRINSGEWMRGEGEEIYNGTGTFFEDMNISKGNIYYYQLWSQANWTYNPTIYIESSQNTSDNYTYIYTPQVATGNATNIMETGAKIEGRLQDNGGNNCTVWFEYGVDTSCNQSTDEQYTENRVLQPNANGHYGGNYNNVLGFDDTTKWATGGNWDNRDSCAVEDMDLENTTVDVQGFLRWSKPGVYPNAALYMFLLNGSNTSQSSYHKIYQGQSQVDWTNSTNTWDICPWTGVEWTEEDINSLDIGFYHDWIGGHNTDSFASQAYINVVAEENSLETNFSQNIYGLNPGQLYWYRAVAENSNGTARGENRTFITKPYAPVEINITQIGEQANITITKGTGANNTYIERNTTPNWERGEGTFICNISGTNYIDTTVGVGTYYYQAWSQSNWTYNPTVYSWSDNNTTGNITISAVAPIITNEQPVDNSTSIAVNSTKIQVNITHPTGKLLNWTIETSPDIGENEGFNDPAGIKNCSIITLTANTSYTWYVNASDGTLWTNETFTFTTSSIPKISNESPTNNTLTLSKPDCSADIYDYNGDEVTVAFYENTTGAWIKQYQTSINTSLSNKVTWSNYSNATEEGESYWWKINITDNKGNYNESIYMFVIKKEFVLSGADPFNTEDNINLSRTSVAINITDPDGGVFNWTIETSPNIGSNSGINEASGEKSVTISGLQQATIYSWFINITNDYGLFNYSYNFTTTYPPYAAMENPSNGSNSSVQPVCTIRAYDVEAGELTATFYENSTGSWMQTSSEENIVVLGGSDYQIVEWDSYYTANNYDTTYWWKVVLEDEKGATNTSIFHFITQDTAPEISNEQPENNETNVDISISSLSAYIEDEEDHNMQWSIETSPDIGSNNGTRTSAGTISTTISSLANNQTYVWYVNVTDGYRWTNETFTFNTSEKPMIYNPYPANGADVETQPTTQIAILDTKDGNVTVTISENSTGSWIDNYQTTIDAHTEQIIYWTYNNATQINETYWWRVTATNEMNATNNMTYYFTTDDSPTTSNPQPTNQTINERVNVTKLFVNITDPNSDTMQWTIETSPDVGNASGSAVNGTINCTINGLSPGTQYTWYVNVSDGDDWTNKSYIFNTSNMFTIIDASPVGVGTTSILPPCTIEIMDPDGDDGTVRFYENTSGSFVLQHTNNSAILDGITETEWPEYSNATAYETRYWWRVNITDGKGNYLEATYNFTTLPNMPPICIAESPVNETTVEPNFNSLSFYLIDMENGTVNYTVESAPSFGSFNITGVNYTTMYQQLIIDVQPNASYIWYLNATDGNSWSRYWFTFNTTFNNQSQMSNPNPSNGTTNEYINRSNVSIYLYDPEGDQLRNIIETSPDVGNENTGFHGNGTYACDLSGLQPGTQYTWYVNITDGGYWNRKWFNFRTSYTPTIEGTSPINNSTGTLNIQPTCQVTIDDLDNDPENMTIRWYDNSSGGWTLQQTNDNILSLPVTVGYQYNGADAYNTTYWWKVNISDGRGCYNETIMQFTTKENDAPQVTSNPTNGTTNIDLDRTNIQIEITDTENHAVNWTIETVPNVGYATGVNESVGTKICNIDNLTADTTYTWYVNITDKYNATTRVYFTFNTTQTPIISGEYPLNNSLAPYQTNCSIDVIDPDGGQVTARFYEYNGSNWLETYSTTITADIIQTVIWNRYQNASTRGNEYSWKVFIEDSKHANITKIFNFTVNNLIQTSDEEPENYQINVDLLIGNISINCSDIDNQTINWSIETSPDIGSASGTNESNGTKICSIINLTTNMTYYWWFNASDSIEEISERYEFSTGNLTVIRNETPPHQSVGIRLQPECSITVNDPDNDTITVEFYEKQGPAYVLMQRNSSINGTHDTIVRWAEYTNASAYDTVYYWRVVVRDDKNGLDVRTYEFTTVEDQLPIISNITPANNEDNIAKTITQIELDINDPEGHLMNWSIETSPDIGSASGTNESNGTISCPISNLVCESSYVWHLNISDGYRSINNTYIFEVAQKPRLINPTPSNGGLYISRKPACNVTAYDPGNNRIDVSIYEYQSGSWVEQITETNLNGSQMNNIVWPEFTNASLFNTTYQWKVVAENDKGCAEEDIYSFTIRRDWIVPTIHWVNVSPSEVTVDMPITFTTQVTDEGGTVDTVKLCLSSIGSNITMIPIGNNTYRYITNFSTEGTYLFYIYATDDEGNSVTSDFYSFEILVKVITVRMYALERVLRDTQNEILIQISHAKQGTQITGIENNISVYVMNPNGIKIIDGVNPTEIEDGLYTTPFNHTNESGTYTAWALITYNGSEYIDATSFELRVEEQYNISGLTDRMQDVFAATSDQSYNSTEEIISHLRQVGIETGALEQETEKFGLTGELYDTAIGTIFQWIFMTLFLLGAFIVGTFIYGRRKGSKLAKNAANVPKYVVTSLTD